MNEYVYHDNSKYISKKGDSWIIRKSINGEIKSFGTFKDYDDAVMHRDKCIHNNWPESFIHQHDKSMKYIYQDPRTGHYQILKQYVKNGIRECYHFGSFKDLTECKEYRDFCIKNDWNEDLMPRNNPTLINPMKYITVTPQGNYRIQKWFNGESISYGTYSSLFDAINERDLLIRYDWDYDLLCEHDERIVDVTIFNNRRMD